MAKAGLGRGLIVLGTHRSGTSAITGAIDALGLKACRAEDRLPASPWNERGYFESGRLTNFDEGLLRLLGGSWWAPPDPPGGWTETDEIRQLVLEAKRLFAGAHPFDRWVWKDPRACTLLSFWDLVLGVDTPRVVVLRAPLETAASLHARSGLPLELGLAIGERMLRSALRDSAGRPVMVTAYDDALEEPRSWCEELAGFVDSLGLSLRYPLAIDDASQFLDAKLRHQRARAGATTAISPAHAALWEWAWSRRGIHPALSVDGLPAESPETDRQIRAGRLFVPVTRRSESTS